MRLILRVVLLVICAGALGCEPLSTDAPLLQAHSDGVVSQVTLSGELVASSPQVDGSSAPPIEAASGPESEAPEPGALVSAPQGGESLSARTQPDGASPAAPPQDSPESPPAAAPAEQLAPELSSGEYGGGSLVVQQISAVRPESEDPPAAAPADSEASVFPASDLELAGPTNEASSGAAPAATSEVELQQARADEFSPSSSLVGGAALSEELSRVLPEAPSSDASALAVLDALPRRSSRTAAENPQDCIPAGSGLLSLSLGQLSMVRAWLDGTLLRAELRGPDGRLYTVVRGDRVGADGGRVLQVSSTQVVVGEIGFGLDGSPFIVQEAIR